MVIRNVTLDGKEYVLIPRKHWERMSRKSAVTSDEPVQIPPASRDGSFSLEHVRISLANKMSARRKAAGLTQAQLAKQARVRVETISRLENGLHMPGIGTFSRIDRILNRAAKKTAA